TGQTQTHSQEGGILSCLQPAAMRADAEPRDFPGRRRKDDLRRPRQRRGPPTGDHRGGRPAMKSLEEYLDDAAVAHGHLCAGQVLGVRMAMFGLRKLGLEDPQGKDRKRIVTFVEIDRCATDAVMVVTGCRLGKRALKFRDWGKVAATFVDVETGKAVRIAARESSKAPSRTMHPEIESKNQQQMLAYKEMSDDQMF